MLASHDLLAGLNSTRWNCIETNSSIRQVWHHFFLVLQALLDGSTSHLSSSIPSSRWAHSTVCGHRACFSVAMTYTSQGMSNHPATAHFIRTTSLTPHSSSLSFRIPSPDLHPYTARIAFRPLLDSAMLSVASPISWQQSERITLSVQEDWKGVVKLEGLAGGTQYECGSAKLVILD